MLGDIYFLPGIFVMSTYQVLLFQSMNKMKKLILLPFILLAISSGAQITKIEHFFVSSPRAEKLFHFSVTVLTCLLFGPISNGPVLQVVD